ncbi:hypothetical protein JG688_00015768 [Phytophthora aleatoria]|uniref:Uncharacterized protein n=1 Tax=Phytophthora aleatoria TaxID=2496075 RepID=A0A8J5MCT1_9STRA|nr:hypothetical protein JG688_00015768 [Phytophthora aleatoria]
MRTEGYQLQWEWCIPQMVNTATKTACGMNQNSKNNEMLELINRVSQIMFQTYRTEKMGT